MGVKVLNLSPFVLKNLSVKMLLDFSTSVVTSNKSSETIEELPSYQVRSLFFIVRIEKYVSLSFAFDILLNDVNVES
jgi:hypothetical protein